MTYYPPYLNDYYAERHAAQAQAIKQLNPLEAFRALLLWDRANLGRVLDLAAQQNNPSIDTGTLSQYTGLPSPEGSSGVLLQQVADVRQELRDLITAFGEGPPPDPKDQRIREAWAKSMWLRQTYQYGSAVGPRDGEYLVVQSPAGFVKIGSRAVYNRKNGEQAEGEVRNTCECFCPTVRLTALVWSAKRFYLEGHPFPDFRDGTITLLTDRGPRTVARSRVTFLDGTHA